MLPASMDVQIASIQQLDNYEQPLIVNLTVKGPIGSAAGKRLLVANDIFLSNTKPAFPHEKREIPVYFHYPYYQQDVVRVIFPQTIKLESAPSEQELQFQNFAIYKLTSNSTPNSVTVRRDFILGELVFMPNEYPNLRAFYNKFETKDQESIVLTAAAPAAAKPVTGN
jgi:hypothetical protein